MNTIQELFGQHTDALRSAIQAELRAMFTTLPGILKTQGDGHNVTVNSAINGIQRMDDGSFQQVQVPDFDTMPVHFPAGGQVVATHPVHAGDEGIILFSARAIDTWRQSGGVQPPIDARQHHASDAFWIGGVKSDPNKIQNYAPDSHQVRSLDARVTHEVHPTNGLTAKVVDPSDNSSNPFASAVTFYQTIHNSVSGLIHSAVQSGITHLASLTHAAGHLISVANGNHTVNVHPTNGIISNTSANINSTAQQSISQTATTGNINLTSTAQSIIQTAANQIDLNAPTVDVSGVLSAAGAISGGSISTGGSASCGSLTVGGNAYAPFNPPVQAHIFKACSTPSGTTSSSYVNMGLDVQLTPTTTGVILVSANGIMTNTVNSGTVTAILAYGTGTPPSNGSSSGTTIGHSVRWVPDIGSTVVPFSLTGIVDGLTVGTAYWFDVQLETNGTGTAACNFVNVSAMSLT